MKRNPRVRQIGVHVNDYDSALKFLGGKQERSLANNTRVVNEGDSIAVVLHRTAVVRYFATGGMQLSSGGYETATTKQRINQLLPPGYSLAQRKQRWFLHGPWPEPVEFYDGMMLDSASGAAWRKDYDSNPRGPGKFGDCIEELLYNLDPDQSVGSSGELGWYGLVSGLLKPDAMAAAADLDIEWDNGEAVQYDWPLNAIIREGNDGDITVTTFKSNRELLREWRDIEEKYDAYYGDDGEG